MWLPGRERETDGQGNTKSAEVACHVLIGAFRVSENECRDALRKHDHGNPRESRT
jgi:hypothetical protein